MHFETAKKALDVLDKSYKVSEWEKRVKLQTLCIYFGLIWIKKQWDYWRVFSRTQKLVNQMKANGEKMTDLLVIKKKVFKV